MDKVETYKVAIAGVGSVVLAISAIKLPHLEVGSLLLLSALALLALVFNSLHIYIAPDREVSLAFVPYCASALLLGTGPTIWIAAASSLLREAALLRAGFKEVLFGVGQQAILIGGLGLGYTLAQTAMPPSSAGKFVAMIGGLMVFLMADMALGSVGMLLEGRRRIGRMWISNLGWVLPRYLALSAGGFGMSESYLWGGGGGLFAASMAFWVAAFALLRMWGEGKRLYYNTACSFSAAIDAKDRYTKGHSDRVTAYAAAIARNMGLSERKIERIYYAAQLHDIGKIGVREEILNKPGKLDPQEFADIKEHPARSFEILKHLPQLGRIAQIVRHHHERYDGSGYPDGLAGDGIPLGSRIISVADAFDAMMSDRAYRSRFPEGEALKRIREGSGVQFEPGVVEAFEKTHRAGMNPEASPFASCLVH